MLSKKTITRISLVLVMSLVISPTVFGGEITDLDVENDQNCTDIEQNELNPVDTNNLGSRTNESVSDDSGKNNTPVNADYQTTCNGFIPESSIIVENVKKYADSDISVLPASDDEAALASTFSTASIPTTYPSGGIQYLVDNYPALENQNPFGCCWAFSLTACGMFDMVKNHGKPRTINYSEAMIADNIYNTHYTVYRNSGDQVKHMNTIYGDAERSTITRDATDREKLNAGGNVTQAAHMMLNGYGFVTETNYDYPEDNSTDFDSSGNYTRNHETERGHKCSGTSALNTAVLDSMIYIPMSNRDAVKQAIMSSGAISTSFYYNSAYEDSAHHRAYYCPSNIRQNHAIAIVGWDDNYPIGNFKTAPSRQGAWLVRNSWAANEANENIRKYFWMSYEDKSLDSVAYQFKCKDPTNRTGKRYYTNMYHYTSNCHNISGVSNYNTNEVAANVYPVASSYKNQLIYEVAFATFSPANSYEIDIYKDVTGAPGTGKKIAKSHKEGTLPGIGGVYTVELDTPIFIKSGTSFAVVVTLKNSIYTVACEQDITGSEAPIEIQCRALQGQSYYKNSLGGWSDITGSGMGNFCIWASADNTDATEDPYPDPSDNYNEREDGKVEVPVTDPIGGSGSIVYDPEKGSFETPNGEQIAVISLGDNTIKVEEPSYSYTGKKLVPGKGTFVIFDGVMYKYKQDYTCSAKQSKNVGEAVATIKWKKTSEPYKKGVKKSTLKFKIAPRDVEDAGCTIGYTYNRQKNKLKKLYIEADGVKMKPKKKDYSCSVSGNNTMNITFSNNYKGTINVPI